MTIADNLHFLRDEMASACARARRQASEVRLMVVSKTQPAEAILEAYAAGQRVFGENRVQEAQAKSPQLTSLDALELHLIGPLQNNKTTRAAELFHAVDTLDSMKTAQRLNAAAQALGRTLGALVEVKLSPEASKHGLPPEQLGSFLQTLKPLSCLQVTGLMTVPPASQDPEAARPFFARLRQLREAHAARHPQLTDLSMGMSHDFRVAIEEGATTIRIGTALFGARS